LLFALGGGFRGDNIRQPKAKVYQIGIECQIFEVVWWLKKIHTGIDFQ